MVTGGGKKGGLITVDNYKRGLVPESCGCLEEFLNAERFRSEEAPVWSNV